MDDGFHAVTLWPSDPVPTARLLTGLFGYKEAEREASDGTERLRFRSPAGGRGAVDLIRLDAPSIGRQGAGSIHHVAFRAESRRSRVNGASASPTSALTSRP